MKISILGSSSSGNSTFVEAGNTKILIDVGFSLKTLISKLNNIGEKIEDIDSIFITHEHIDHVKSLGPILRKYDIDIYIHRDSFEIIKDKIGKYSVEKIKFLDKRITYINNVVITNFDLTHDSNHCLGYSIEEKNKKFVYITDTGYVSKIMEYNCMNANVIAIESNYDYDMLITGSYPWNIKDRIKSKYGHLSNNDALKLLKNIDTKNLKKIYLMHLSDENNMEALAIHNIRKEFKELDIEISGEEVTRIYEI